MSEETAKKLAMEVRQSNKSEEFDLSGYGPNSVTKLVQDAFTAPLQRLHNAFAAPSQRFLSAFEAPS